MTWNNWQQKVQEKTEQVLTWYKRRRLHKKEKQKKKGQIRDWIEALLWAAVFVLILNQYILQAYAIPSGSMLHTIQLEDRIFVDKLVYGPELLPGIGKLPGIAEPKRGEIIIFENPRYEEEEEMGRKVGAVEQLFHRLVYMLTFSLVNLDVKPNGEIAHHFLVKRLVGIPGDRIRQKNGAIEIIPASGNEWIPEKELIQKSITREYLNKYIPYELYPELYHYIKIEVYKSRGLPVEEMSADALKKLKKLEQELINKTGKNLFLVFLKTDYEMSCLKNSIYYKLKPHDESYLPFWARYHHGWYISETRIFPMGDNRDDSHDARYFHPVRLDKVLGRAAFRFWPINRIGSVE
jgi:signal peptidase I